MPVMMPAAGRGVVVHAVGGQRGELEEGRARVEQGADALARQQLAAVGVLGAGLRRRRRARRASSWASRSATVARSAAALSGELGAAGVDVAVDDGHVRLLVGRPAQFKTRARLAAAPSSTRFGLLQPRRSRCALLLSACQRRQRGPRRHAPARPRSRRCRLRPRQLQQRRPCLSVPSAPATPAAASRQQRRRRSHGGSGAAMRQRPWQQRSAVGVPADVVGGAWRTASAAARCRPLRIPAHRRAGFGGLLLVGCRLSGSQSSERPGRCKRLVQIHG